jgi:hypothetical protein
MSKWIHWIIVCVIKMVKKSLMCLCYFFYKSPTGLPRSVDYMLALQPSVSPPCLLPLFEPFFVTLVSNIQIILLMKTGSWWCKQGHDDAKILRSRSPLMELCLFLAHHFQSDRVSFCDRLSSVVCSLLFYACSGFNFGAI